MSAFDPLRTLALGRVAPVPASFSSSFLPIADIKLAASFLSHCSGSNRMHFHVPKPLHGWREFAGEVGIIVIGIVIALTLEAVVSGWENQRIADHARADIREELSSNSQALRRMIGSQQQAIKRLEMLRKFLQSAADGKRAQLPVGFSIPSEFESMDTSSWESAVATQALSHMPSNQVHAIAQAYSGSRELNDFEQLAVKQSVEMASISPGAGEMSAEEARTGFRQVSVAMAYSASLSAAAAGLLNVNKRAIGLISPQD